MEESSSRTWTPWWDRPTAQLCRNASPGAGCSWTFLTQLECHTEPHPESGQPVKRCVKLHKRLMNCPGRPPVTDEQQQEVTAYGDAAPTLDLGLRLSDTPVFPSLPARDKVQTQDVGQAFADFLRFAEELQQTMAPGVLELDERPAPTPQVAVDEKEESLLSKVFRFRRPGAAHRPDSQTWQEYAKDFTEV
ncbi:hypothetical protein ACKKBF_B04050 [Auxenochlorella protothecoides x Auxenochlorella symbiontica]